MGAGDADCGGQAVQPQMIEPRKRARHGRDSDAEDTCGERARSELRELAAVALPTGGQEADGGHWRARVDLALCYRLCERFSFHEGVCNHLSFQLPGQDRFLLIDYGVHWSRARASDILVLDFDGNVLIGSGEPERTGFVSHRAMHRALGSGAAAIFHTHMPFATALTCLRPDSGGRLLPVHQNMLKFNGHVAYDDEWGGLFDDSESDRTTAVARRFVEEHGRCPRVMLCASHGVFAFGHSIAEAWDNLYYLERLCEVQVRALSCAGGDLSRLRLIEHELLAEGAPLAEADRPRSIAAHWKAMQGLMEQDMEEYKLQAERPDEK